MCLIIKKGQRYRIAKEDIVCYKVVKKLFYSLKAINGQFYAYCSPFQTQGISKEEIEGKIPYNAGTQFNRGCFYGDGLRAIGAGAVHTYVNEYYSETTPIGSELKTFVEYKCVIPKGTKYYIGKDQTGRESYASEKIVFKEKIS